MNEQMTKEAQTKIFVKGQTISCLEEIRAELDQCPQTATFDHVVQHLLDSHQEIDIPIHLCDDIGL